MDYGMFSKFSVIDWPKWMTCHSLSNLDCDFYFSTAEKEKIIWRHIFILSSMEIEQVSIQRSDCLGKRSLADHFSCVHKVLQQTLIPKLASQWEINSDPLACACDTDSLLSSFRLPVRFSLPLRILSWITIHRFCRCRSMTCSRRFEASLLLSTYGFVSAISGNYKMCFLSVWIGTVAFIARNASNASSFSRNAAKHNFQKRNAFRRAFQWHLTP